MQLTGGASGFGGGLSGVGVGLGGFDGTSGYVGPRFNRFYAFLGLFTAAMLGLVLADDFLLLMISWELVGGAVTAAELVKQLDELVPDVVVVDAALPGVGIGAIRRAAPRARVIALGPLEGADGVADSPQGIRDAILGLPPMGGPVRR